MFAKRPRFDDTFGVRMDLGADRMDPMSLRPSSEAGQLRVKAPVIVQQPRSILDIFGSRDMDPLAALRETPSQDAPSRTYAEPQAAGAKSSQSAPQQGPRAFETGLLGVWKRLSPGQRLGLGTFAGLFLFASGLWMPAIFIAVVYFVLRGRAA